MRSTLLLLLMMIGLTVFYLHDKGFFDKPEDSLVGYWVPDSQSYLSTYFTRLRIPADTKREMLANPSTMNRIRQEAQAAMQLRITLQTITFSGKDIQTETSAYSVVNASPSSVTIEFFDKNLEKTTQMSFSFTNEQQTTAQVKHELLRAVGLGQTSTFAKQ